MNRPALPPCGSPLATLALLVALGPAIVLAGLFWAWRTPGGAPPKPPLEPDHDPSRGWS